MSLAGRIAHSTIYQTVGKVIAVFLGLLQVYLLVRYFGAQGYGQYATVTAFFGVAIAMAELGLHITNVTNISRPDVDKSKVLSNAFTLRVVSSVIILSIAALVGFYVFPYEPTIKYGIVFASLAFAFLSVNQVFVGVFQKYFANHMLVFGEIAAKTVVIAAIIILGRMGAGVLAVIISLNIAFGLHLALTMFFAHRYIPFGFDFDFKYWRALFSQSWPIAFSAVLNLVYFRADTIILSVYKDSSTVGVYNVPYKVLEVLIAFPALFAGLLLPILSLAAHKGEFNKFRNFIQRGFDFLMYVGLLVVVETLIFAEEIIKVVTQNRVAEFHDSVPLLRLLILAIIFIFIGNLFGHAIPALHLQKRMIAGYASAAVAGLMFYFILIPRFSYFGAAIGTIATELIAAAFAAFLVLRKTKYSLSLLSVAKAALVAAITGLVGLALTTKLQFVPWVLAAVLVAVLYIVFLYALKIIRKEDLRLLWSKRAQISEQT